MDDGGARRPRPHVEVHDLGWDERSFLDAALDGLSRQPKAIPCEFLYDQRGSLLFDEICDLPEYYQTRTEIGILREGADAIADLIGGDAVLYELGSGSSVKTPILLNALDTPAAYVPIDVSRAHLLNAADAIAGDYPDLRVVAVCGDYASPDALPPVEGGGRQAAFFPGSTIGNLARDDAGALLRKWRAHLGDDGVMVVGVDLKKSPELIEAAYNDAAGVTEAFIKNVLAHANDEFGAGFDLDAFTYEGRYRHERGRVEMHLVSREDQEVSLDGETIHFAEGERLHVENSHKYAPEEFAALARDAGFGVQRMLTDPNKLFSVQLLTAR